MHERFLADGGANYRKALEAEYRDQLAELQAERKTADTESRRLELDSQIARLAETHRAQRQTARHSLF